MRDGTFFFYKWGVQYYLKGNYALWICFPDNHFVSRVEDFTGASRPKTVYEFGTHYYLRRMNVVRSVVLDVADGIPLWAEVVHDRNVDNDVKMRPGFRFVRDADLLYRFGVHRKLDVGYWHCRWRFLPHAFAQFVRRIWWKLTGHRMGQ